MVSHEVIHDRRKRAPFTRAESMAIRDYIVKYNLQHLVNRRSTWRSMELAHITNHSAEAMRNHYRHVLAPLFSDIRPTNRVRHKTRKQSFTEQDDEAIVNYINKYNLHDFLGCRAVWAVMQRDLHLSHSAESLRSRFRRCLRTKLSHTAPNEPRTNPAYRTTIELANHDRMFEDSFSIVGESTFGSGSPNISSSSQIPLSIDVRVKPSSSTGHNCFSRTVEHEVSSAGSPTEFTPSSPSSSNERLHLQTPAILASLSHLAASNHHSSASYVTALLKSCTLLTNPLQPHLLVSMTNGSLSEAVTFLQTGQRYPSVPSHPSPPLWTPEDDEQLNSCEITLLHQVLRKFGSMETCRRISYLAS